MNMIEGSTSESLEAIKVDLDEFLDDKKKEKEKEKSEDVNPFSALFSIFKSEKKKEKDDLSKGVRKDSSEEKVLRSQAIIRARAECSKLYGGYKGANDMPGF